MADVIRMIKKHLAKKLSKFTAPPNVKSSKITPETETLSLTRSRHVFCLSLAYILHTQIYTHITSYYTILIRQTFVNLFMSADS